MAVALDALATAFLNLGVTSFTDTSLTIGVGSNRALIFFFAIDTNVSSLVAQWDSTGTPQTMYHIGVKAASDASMYVHKFGLRAPTSGNKTLSVSWTGTAGYMGMMASFTGADQTADATTFKNVVTDASTPTAAGNYPYPSGMTITTITGDMAVLTAASRNGFMGTGSGLGTQIGLINSSYAADDRYLAAAGASTIVAANEQTFNVPYCGIGCAIAAVGNITSDILYPQACLYDVGFVHRPAATRHFRCPGRDRGGWEYN